MPKRPGFAACAPLLLAAALTGCWQSRPAYLDSDLPLVAPLTGVPGSPGGDYDDPPARIGRVSRLSGPVSVQQGGLEAWTGAVLNLPLKGGDTLWSGPKGRAEVQIGSTELRLGEATGLSVLRINDRFFQVGLDTGSLIVHIVPGEFPDSAEIDTPAGAVNLDEAGTYRVDLDPALPAGGVTVRTGAARVSLEGEVLPVAPGERILLSGGAEPWYLGEKAPSPDDLDTWSASRDRETATSRSALKLGRELMGAEDLDGAGSWQAHPQYGELWVPKVAPGWAPYRAGRWTWADPWGWTWVDGAPWGFAPSHYGRWLNLAGTWAWLPRDPAATAARPVYAPALVAFAGQTPGLRPQGGLPGGGVAWFPLGPREPFLPAYPASRGYLQRLNAPAAAPPAPPQQWANLPVRGAVTAVPRSTFTTCAGVAEAAVPMDGAKLFRTAPVGSAPALAPTVRSFQVAPALTRAPAGAGSRPLLARSPLPGPLVPFTARAASLQAGQGRPQAAAALTLRNPTAAQARPWSSAVVPGTGAALRNRTLPVPPPPPLPPPPRNPAPAQAEPAPRKPAAAAAKTRQTRKGKRKGRAAKGAGGSAKGKAEAKTAEK